MWLLFEFYLSTDINNINVYPMFPDQQSAKTMESMREFAKSHLLIKSPGPAGGSACKKTCSGRLPEQVFLQVEAGSQRGGLFVIFLTGRIAQKSGF